MVRTIKAESGLECMDKVYESNNYDLTLMNIIIPIMSCEITLKELKENFTFHTSVIDLIESVITGAGKKYISNEFTDYITKPFS